MNIDNTETYVQNKKCSSKDCRVSYIENNHIFSPHCCELCNNYFCFNCMYLMCSICHKSFTCFWCGVNFKEKQKTNGHIHYIPKCMKHVKTTVVKCEEIHCMCRETI
jgi:hypothetical protein